MVVKHTQNKEAGHVLNERASDNGHNVMSDTTILPNYDYFDKLLPCIRGKQKAGDCVYMFWYWTWIFNKQNYSRQQTREHIQYSPNMTEHRSIVMIHSGLSHHKRLHLDRCHGVRIGASSQKWKCVAIWTKILDAIASERPIDSPACSVPRIVGVNNLPTYICTFNQLQQYFINIGQVANLLRSISRNELLRYCRRKRIVFMTIALTLPELPQEAIHTILLYLNKTNNQQQRWIGWTAHKWSERCEDTELM